MKSSENAWTRQLAHRIISVYKAAKSAFANVVIIPGTSNIIVCSPQPLTKDPAILSSRLQSRSIKPKLVSAAYINYLYTNDRFYQMENLLSSTSVPANTDVHPICYQYTLMIWLSKFIPSIKFLDLNFFELGNTRFTYLWWMAGLGIPALLLKLTRWRMRRIFLMAAAGFAGMVLETVLILFFQIKNGILYQDVGILLTGFMTGLSLGAIIISKIRIHAQKGIGIGFLLAFAALSAFIGVRIHYGMEAGLASSVLLLFAAGFLVAGIFGYASAREAEDQGKVITPLYSADLIGGCLGSVVTSLVLAPIAGLDATAYLMAPVVILAILLL
jgi:hypothetical protein